jgi:hypothetical protein
MSIRQRERYGNHDCDVDVRNESGHFVTQPFIVEADGDSATFRTRTESPWSFQPTARGPR